MTNYEKLVPGKYYLIQELENGSVELVFVPMVSAKCVLVEYQDEDQTLAWFRKTDEIFEIVDELTDEQAEDYESLFDDEDDDDDDDDFFWGDVPDEDEDDDDDEESWEGDEDVAKKN